MGRRGNSGGGDDCIDQISAEKALIGYRMSCLPVRVKNQRSARSVKVQCVGWRWGVQLDHAG